jgi:hypothetical protein
MISHLFLYPLPPPPQKKKTVIDPIPQQKHVGTIKNISQNQSYFEAVTNSSKWPISHDQISKIIQQLLETLLHCNDFEEKQSIIKKIMPII